MAESIGTIQGHIDLETGKFNAAVKGVHRRFDGMNKKMSATGRIMQTAVGTAIGFLSAQALPALGRAIRDVVDRSAELGALDTAFGNFTQQIDSTADSMLNRLRPATHGLVSDFQLIQSTNQAVTLGVAQSEQQWGQLAGAAVKLGRAVGIDARHAVDSLTIGLGRQSTKVLDNLGVIVKAEEANRRYAVQLGKNVEELTDAERKTAFLELATQRIIETANAAGDTQLRLGDRVHQARVRMGNFFDQVVRGINRSPELNRELGVMADRLAHIEKEGHDAGQVLGVALGQAMGDAVGLLNRLTRSLEDSATKTDQMRGAMDSLAPLFGPFGGGVRLLNDAIADYIDEAEEAIRVSEEIEKPLQTMADLWGRDFAEGVETASTALRGNVRPVSEVRAELEKMRREAKEAAAAIMDDVRATVRLGDTLNTLTKGDLEAFNDELGFTEEFVYNVEGAANSLGGPNGTIKGFVIPTMEQATDSFRRHKSATDVAKQGFLGFVDSIRTGKRWLDNMISSVLRFVTSIIGGGGFVDALKSAMGGIGGLIGGGAGGSAGGIIGNIIGAITGGGGVGAGAAGAGAAAAGGGGFLAAISGFLTSGLGAATLGIGAVVPFLFKLFGGPTPAEKGADEVGKFLGDRIAGALDKSFLEQIGKSQDRFTAVRTELGSIVDQAGLVEGELSGAIQTARETFAAFDMGHLTAKESADALRSSLSAIIPEMGKIGASQTQVKALGDVFRDMLNRVRLGHLDAADAAGVLEATFPELEAVAGSFGREGKKMFNAIATAMEELGIEGADSFRELAQNAQSSLDDVTAKVEDSGVIISDRLKSILHDSNEVWTGFSDSAGKAVEDALKKFEKMQDELVGGSIVPDMVTDMGKEWKRMEGEFGEATGNMTGSAERFAGRAVSGTRGGRGGSRELLLRFESRPGSRRRAEDLVYELWEGGQARAETR